VKRLNAAGSVVREPAQPWLCSTIGTLRFVVAVAGWNSE